jgi:hypothetical protein
MGLGSACVSHAHFRRLAEILFTPRHQISPFEKVHDGEGAIARSPRRPLLIIYVLFSIGAPTLLPHSVHEPS